MNNRDFTRQATGLNMTESRRRPIWSAIHADPPLLVGIILLCAFGLFILFSASGGDVEVVQRQATIMGGGVLVMLIVSQFNPHVIRTWAPSIYAAGLGLLLLVLLIGVEANGARSWLDLPGLPSFQPSEVLKISVPLSMAWYLGSRPLHAKIQTSLLVGLYYRFARGIDNNSK